ncbi:MAG: capsule biosynthesis protein, partial [Sulfitobacter sp.]|nr:capsule biosynthesis protein [Sulfitobacter sp.]
VGEFESLSVDRDFAERSYTAALAAYDVAVAESRRQSRYLAAHIKPTLAETSIYPDRLLTLTLIAFFSFLIWAILVMVGYSLRDRR